MLKLAFTLAIICTLRSRVFVTGFSLSAEPVKRPHLSWRMQKEDPCGETSRRAFLGGAVTSLLLAPAVVGADTGAEVRGTPLNAFNGLAFQYRGSDFGGLNASELGEPSVTYAEFVAKLKAGEVAFVEFMAPDGDAAYVTFKDGASGTKAPIRIGDGYPIEQHDGYSSPAFAIRTVKNAGVPYKFTVPALRKYNGSS